MNLQQSLKMGYSEMLIPMKISPKRTSVHCDSILIFLGIYSYCDIVKYYESKIKEHDIKTEIVEDIGKSND